MFSDLVKNSRSVRRFHNEKKIERYQLMELVDFARLTPRGYHSE